MTRRLVAAGYHVRGFDTSAQARREFAAVGTPGAVPASDAGSAGTSPTDGNGNAGGDGVTAADTVASDGVPASGMRPLAGSRMRTCLSTARRWSGRQPPSLTGWPNCMRNLAGSGS